jgi:hypothetical protein
MTFTAVAAATATATTAAGLLSIYGSTALVDLGRVFSFFG